ncbi:MAG: hypothetical protein AAGD38_12230 [Acidobacteriota bacterium]
MKTIGILLIALVTLALAAPLFAVCPDADDDDCQERDDCLDCVCCSLVPRATLSVVTAPSAPLAGSLVTESSLTLQDSLPRDILHVPISLPIH